MDHKAIRLGALILAMGCGQIEQQADDTAEEAVRRSESKVVKEQKPADSTGAKGSVDLSFASSLDLSLVLSEGSEASSVPEAVVEPSMSIGENIVLNYARFNIAKIRIKASKEQSAEEKALEEQEIKDEASAASEYEEVVQIEDDLLLVPVGSNGNSKSRTPAQQAAEKKHQDRKEAQVAKLNEKREALKAKQSAELEKAAARDEATKFSGPYVFDAVVGKLLGDAPKVELADGSYRRIEFQLKRDFKSEADEPLLGNVFAIRGTVKVAGEDVPFEMDWHVALNFRLRGDTGISIKSGEDNSLLIDFNLAKWFAGINFGEAKVGSDGKIYVNKTSNHSIMKQVHKNIKTSAGFGKDKNGDGKITKDEVAGQGEETVDAEPS